MTTAAPNPQTGPVRIGMDGDDLVMDGQELAGLADAIGAKSNTLSLLAEGNLAAEQKNELLAEFLRLEPALQKRITIALGVLRSPARIALLNHTIADETVSRGLLAWSASVPGNIILMAGMGERRRVCIWTPSTLKASVTKIAGAETPLPEDEIAFKMSSKAMLLFLAILEQLRAVRLHATLVHAEPDTTFSPSEIMERLRGAATEDFRWPLLFVDKVMPGFVPAITAHEAAEALRELIAVHLVEAVAITPTLQRFDLTDGGKVICREILHDVSKVALSICDQHADGQYGHDLVYLIRTPIYLFLFGLSGPDGAIAALDNEELEEILDRAVTFVPKAAAEAPPAAAEIRCPHCGSGMKEGEKFCTNCGKAKSAPPPPAPVCGRCGSQVTPQMRFCSNCGNQVG